MRIAIHLLLYFVSVNALDFSYRVLSKLTESQRVIKELHPLWKVLLRDTETVYSVHDLIRALKSTALDNLSNDCREDLLLILDPDENLLNSTDFESAVMLPLLDSAGKVGPAILRGHFEFKGHYSQCRAVDFQVPGRERRLRGAYFQVDIDNQLRNNDVEGACDIYAVTRVMWMGAFTFDVCLPDSCSSQELSSIVKPASGPPPSSPNPICAIRKTGDPVPEINAGFYVTISIVIVIASICAASGVVDYFYSEKIRGRMFTRGMSWRIFMAFSFYANLGSIFNVENAKKEGQIVSIHCVRAVSMCWVAMCHSFLYHLMVVANPLDILATSTLFVSQIILNGMLAVDSFFFLSGLMVSFFWFKMYKKNARKTNSLRGWIMFYVHRIWRLSPPLFINVLFYTFILKQLIIDSPYNLVEYAWWDKCSWTWWWEILYVHNYADWRNICLGYSWYVDADMQIFLFTPILLLPMAFKPILAFIVASLVLIVSTGLNIFMVYRFHWPIYVMGMYIGWMLQRMRRLRMHWILNIVGWLTSFALMTTVLFGLYGQWNGQEVPLFWRAMYSSLSRPAWGLVLSWIVIACWYGYGGPINDVMSASFWIPLGRLTYCGYLSQIPVIMLISSLSKNEVWFSSLLETFTTLTIPIWTVTFLVAAIYSAVFEVTFVKIEAILLGGSISERKKMSEEET